MQVCTSLQTDNHASTPPLSFFTGWMPCCPTNSIKALKANVKKREAHKRKLVTFFLPHHVDYNNTQSSTENNPVITIFDIAHILWGSVYETVWCLSFHLSVSACATAANFAVVGPAGRRYRLTVAGMRKIVSSVLLRSAVRGSTQTYFIHDVVNVGRPIANYTDYEMLIKNTKYKVYRYVVLTT